MLVTREAGSPEASRVVLVCAVLAGCGAAHSTTSPVRSHGEADSAPQRADAGRDSDGAATAQDAGHRYDNSILSFVAARAYHDFPSLDVKSDSKFEVFLLPTIRPSDVQGLRVLGPDGFVFDFINEPFASTLNGYLQNDREPTLWYQAIRITTLDEGRYTARVTFVNGERHEYSRDLVSNDAMLDFYLEHGSEMKYEPREGMSPADGTTLTWSTLHDLGGPDAYYNAWISSEVGEGVSTQDLRGDNIFLGAFSDPNAGLNAGSSRLGSPDDPLPLGPKTWQPEITDSNHLDGINQIIFPPGQHFVAN
jgi:hypothetical protein